jgi:hypothetical protein
LSSKYIHWANNAAGAALLSALFLLVIVALDHWQPGAHGGYVTWLIAMLGGASLVAAIWLRFKALDERP